MNARVKQAARFKARHEALLADLDVIEQGVTEGRPLKAHALVEFLSRQIPGLNGVLSNLRKVLANANNFLMAIREPTRVMRAAARALPFAGLAIDAVNFLLYPFSLVVTRIMTGEWPPKKTSTASKFAYAVLLLSLSVLTVSVPPLGPFMALTSLGLSFAMAIWSVYNVSREQKKLRAEWESFKTGKLKEKLDNETEQFNQLFEANAFALKAADLRVRWQSLRQENQTDPDIQEQIAACKRDIILLQKAYDSAKAPLQRLLDRRVRLKQKHDKIISSVYTYDKLVSLGTLTLAFLGVALALAFPPMAPIGFSIAAASLGVLALYGTARFFYPMAKKLVSRLLGHSENTHYLPPGGSTSQLASHLSPEDPEKSMQTGVRNMQQRIHPVHLEGFDFSPRLDTPDIENDALTQNEDEDKAYRL